jgi:hypothetical protein
VAYTAARHTPAAGSVAAGQWLAEPQRRPRGTPAAAGIRGSRAAGRRGGFSFYLKFQKILFPLLKILENPFLLRKLRNLFQKISKISNSGMGWCLSPCWFFNALIWI